MKYYVYKEAVYVCLIVLEFVYSFELWYFTSAVLELYVFICSYSLYKESLNSLPDDTENMVIIFQNIPAPPPQYVCISTCEQDLTIRNMDPDAKLHS